MTAQEIAGAMLAAKGIEAPAQQLGAKCPVVLQEPQGSGGVHGGRRGAGCHHALNRGVSDGRMNPKRALPQQITAVGSAAGVEP
jgi:hypothetical protein